MKTITATLSLLLLLAVPLAAQHPLEPLTADEHLAAFAIARAAVGVEDVLFPFIALHEPPKATVRNWNDGSDFPREATVHVMHPASNRLWVATVDLRAQRVSRLELMPNGTQAAVTASEFLVADEIVRAYEPWLAAMRARGIDPDDVYIDVWAPGDQEGSTSTRLLRALAFLRGGSVDDFDPDEPQNPYARPIEG
ncbi:MAG: hypothetical protein ACLGH0_00740, partial [Thermoanaerobaculia bacterium]